MLAPPYEAVTTTETDEVTLPPVIANVADVEPFATVTLEGILAALVLELDREIKVAEVAGPESVTVPVLDCPLEIAFGLTDTLESAGAVCVGGATVTPNPSLTPAYEADNCTGVELVTVPAVALNVADVEPCATDTDDGIVTSAGEALRVAVAPPLGAAAVRETVQENPAPDTTEVELHENPFSAAGCAIDTRPSVVEAGSDHPVASTARGF